MTKWVVGLIVVVAVVGGYGGLRIFSRVRPESIVVRNETAYAARVDLGPTSTCGLVDVAPQSTASVSAGWVLCRNPDVQITAIGLSPSNLSCRWGDIDGELRITDRGASCSDQGWQPWGFTCEEVAEFVDPDNCTLPTPAMTPAASATPNP